MRGYAKEVRGAGAAGMIKKSLSIGFNFVFFVLLFENLKCERLLLNK